jgi:hypothetical protein
VDGLSLWRRRLTGKLKRLKFAQTKVNFLSGLIEDSGAGKGRGRRGEGEGRGGDTDCNCMGKICREEIRKIHAEGVVHFSNIF